MSKILLVCRHINFFSKGLIVRSDMEPKEVLRLQVPLLQAIAMRFHLLSRLLRLGVHHLIRDGENGYYCIYNKYCARFTSDGTVIGKPIKLIGGRPLRVDIYNGMMIYGEYRSNPERKPVAVYAFDGHTQKALFEVENVRHIHSVKVRYDKVYFSTGDYEGEAGIWFWDGKSTHNVLQGGQQHRAVDFILADDGIYYGTDTPLEKNYIYKASYDGELTKLQTVSSSVFYMSEQAQRYWLATVVEPSDVNTSKYVELWASHKDDKTKWQLVRKYKKDIWSMKYFQYGQIQFPYVEQADEDRVWFYLQGVAGSGQTVCLDTKDLN